jgi:hypothetical protein
MDIIILAGILQTPNLPGRYFGPHIATMVAIFL